MSRPLKMDPANFFHRLGTSEMPEGAALEGATTATSESLNSSNTVNHVDHDNVDTPASQVLNTAELLENILTRSTIFDIAQARQVNQFFRALIDNSKPLRCPMFRVLGSKKLLEHILLQSLSLKQVAQVQGVCRFFKKVVETSKPLRQFMFLEPQPVREASVHRNTPRSLVPTSIHPLVRTMPSGNGSTVEFFPIDKAAALLEFECEMFRSMLICQPPCKEFSVALVELGQLYFVPGSVKGNTLGDLVDELRKLQSQRKTTFASGDLLGMLHIAGFVDGRSRSMPSKRQNC